MFSDSVIAEVKERTDIIEVLSSYGIKVHGAGASAKCLCPFHHEKTASFSIDGNKGLYHCFGCGESGDVIKFVQKYDGVDFSSAVRKLASKCGVQIDERQSGKSKRYGRLYALMSELAEFYKRCLLQTKEAEDARQYLEKRELSKDIQDKYTLGYAPKSLSSILKWAQVHGYSEDELVDVGVLKRRDGARLPYYYFGGRLMFSIRDKSGRTVAFSGRQIVLDKKSGKYVNSPETAIFKKGRILFGLDMASSAIVKSPNREVIICEGQIDCIRLQNAGLLNTVASQGTAFTEVHAAMLKRLADTAILCFDDDSAGHSAAYKAAEQLLTIDVPVKVVNLPDGKDPDEFIRSEGGEAFSKLMRDNVESIVSYVIRTSKAAETSPETLDASARISRHVLALISKCHSPILRENMVKEASILLEVSKDAVYQELMSLEKGEESNKEESKSDIAEDLQKDIVERTFDTKDAGEANLTCAERALIQFLWANEGDPILKSTVRSLLPPYVFSSRLCRGYVSEWIASTKQEDLISRYFERLEEVDYQEMLKCIFFSPYYDDIGNGASETVFYYARQIWIDFFIKQAMCAKQDEQEENLKNQKKIVQEFEKFMKLGRKSMLDFVKNHST